MNAQLKTIIQFNLISEILKSQENPERTFEINTMPFDNGMVATNRLYPNQFLPFSDAEQFVESRMADAMKAQATAGKARAARRIAENQAILQWLENNELPEKYENQITRGGLATAATVIDNARRLHASASVGWLGVEWPPK